jgi:uncharacterized protein YndB with AHSA1/START domain
MVRLDSTARLQGRRRRWKSVFLPYGQCRNVMATQEERNAQPHTVTLHHVLATTLEKVFRAFVEADAIASWLPPYGYTCTIHELDAKIGGKHRMSFRNFTTGDSHAFGGTYKEPIAGQRLVYTDRFDDPNLPGEMTVTVTLKAVSVGTEVSTEQQGIPDVIRARPAISDGRSLCVNWRNSSIRRLSSSTVADSAAPDLSGGARTAR